MTIPKYIEDYTFDITPQHLEPLIAEPIVQTGLAFISHVGAALVLLQRLIQLAQMLRVGETLMKLIRIYIPAIA